MDASKAQRGLGSVSLTLAAADWTIGLLDAWGRWDILMNMPHVGLLKLLLAPQVVPVLVFVGMLLWNRASKKESDHLLQHERSLWERSQPALYGVEEYRTIPKNVGPWKYLLFIPAITTCVALILAIQLCFFLPSPPQPSPPDVNPLAYLGFSQPEARRVPTIQQKVIENNGTITGGQMNGNSIINGAKPPKKTIGILIDKSVKGPVQISDIHMCSGTQWSCLLMEWQGYMETGQTEKFDNLVTTVNMVIDLRTQRKPEEALECHREMDNAIALLRASAQNEPPVIRGLIPNAPVCFRQR